MAGEKEYIEIKKIVNDVQNYVERAHHAFIVPEHLLLVLLKDKKVNNLFKQKKVSVSDIEKDLNVFFDGFETVSDISKIVPTVAYTQIMQKAVMMAGLRAKEPDSLQVLLSIYSDKDSHAYYYLNKHGIKENDVLEYIQNKQSVSTTFLEKYAVNLVDMARLGNIDKIVGREKEINRMIQILNKRKSNCALLVGVSGCGKTAVVEGFAKRIAEDNVPESIKGYDVWSLDMGAMIAGTKFRGEFEERLQNVIKEIVNNPNSFVFIDELHTVVGAGTGTDNSLDASNILKPYLAKGSFRLIGATTYEEYKNKILKDKAFARRFKKIDLNEPSKEETFEILKGMRKYYEDYHKVKFEDEILKEIVDLSGRYIIDRFFPDKAIDIMDELGAQYRSGLKKGDKVQKIDVEDVVSKMANIEEITAGKSEKDRIKELDVNIKKELFGQDEIVDSVVRKIKMTKANLWNKDKGLSFLLLGSSGCGKTEFCKVLAKNLGMNFVKLDMSEYSEKSSVSKLIGADPGLIGFDQPGTLTEPLIRQPNSVVLLDEIEKADSHVYNLLLQVLDEGRLRDNNNREANFKNAIVVMTTNVGVAGAEQSSKSVGFIKTDEDYTKEKQAKIEEIMKKTFSPEFRNRIQQIYFFNNLNKDNMKSIVDKNIKRINDGLIENNIEIELTDSAKEYIVEEADKEKMGGRPVERLINKYISEKLVDEILYGKLEKGGKVKIDFQDKEFVYNF